MGISAARSRATKERRGASGRMRLTPYADEANRGPFAFRAYAFRTVSVPRPDSAIEASSARQRTALGSRRSRIS